MQTIYLLLTLSLLWLNIAGLTVVSFRYLADNHLARASGVIILCLSLFFIEHFIGLGKLNWLWPLTSAAAAFVIYKQKSKLNNTTFLRAEIVFIVAFIYALAWRFGFPSISPSSERITDLYFITNYLPGNTLPPIDNWNPPQLFDFYYAFQHYAAALLGRIFSFDPGQTYNIAFALLMALSITLVWSIAGKFIKNRLLKLLLVATVVFGGTGISPLLHFVLDPVPEPTSQTQAALNGHKHALYRDAFNNIVKGARFIGSPLDKELSEKPNASELTQTLFPKVEGPENNPLWRARVLPLENFGYQFFLGDYHPPLGGFFLLFFTLALMFACEKKIAITRTQALMGLSVPVMLITNTWTFPLQGLLLVGWVAFRYWDKKPVHWDWLIGGGLVGAMLIYPFFTDFANGSLSTPVKLVTGFDHTPVSRFVALLWPLLLLIVCALFEPKYRKLSITLASTFALMLFISEVIYIDDPTGDHFLRTNTVMKWWGWIYVGGILSLGALCLGSSNRVIQGITVVTFLTINMYAIDLSRYWVNAAKSDLGKLSGDHQYTKNKAQNAMFEYLKTQPFGILLENVPDNAYMDSSVYALFNNKAVVLGWPSHLRTWHGDVPQVWQTKSEIKAFYKGQLPNATDWLAAKQVNYIVLSRQEDATYFSKIDQQISADYTWQAFTSKGQSQKGIWTRKKLFKNQSNINNSH